MAVIPYEIISTPYEASGTILVRWLTLTDDGSDTGQPFVCPAFADKSIQLIGTLGAAGQCTIEGSNMPSTPTYATLNDMQGQALVMVALGIETVLENTYLVRPSITAGDGTTDLDVYMLVSTSR